MRSLGKFRQFDKVSRYIADDLIRSENLSKTSFENKPIWFDGKSGKVLQQLLTMHDGWVI